MAEAQNWQSFIEELKAKNDIVSVVSRYMPLERKGRTYWCRCPFHGEKTPSLAINEADQFYHCFGCGVGGDVVKFVQEIESVDFMGAVQILADLAHMEVPSFSTEQRDENRIKERKQQRDRLLSLTKEVARHYVENLKSPQAQVGLEYFEKRKISPQLARMFGLGFSINYFEIINYLSKLGYTVDEMEKAGVVKRKSLKDKPIDPMGGRIVFPIMDANGNVLAFCGRTLDPKPTFAKYLNTAETELFSKSKNLYAINLIKKAKLAGQKLDYLIIVEGQMDVVSLHKAGFNMAVASMGTALTHEQAKLMKRFCDKVFICYDGDTAGKKATLRGLDILRDNGLEVFVMSLPEGMDPDDIINRYGKEGYQKLIDKALPLIDFKLDFLKKLYDVSSADGRTKYVNEAIEVLRSLSDVEREIYIEKVSEIAGIMRDFLKRKMQEGSNFEENSPMQKNNANVSLTIKANETRQKKPVDSKVAQAEKFILSAMIHSKPYAYFKSDLTEYFSGNRAEFYSYIKELIENGKEKEAPKLLYQRYSQHLDDGQNPENDNKLEEISEIINYIMRDANEQNEGAYFKDCLFIIYKNYADEQIILLNEQAQNEPDIAKRKQILEKINQIFKNLKDKKVEL